MAARRPALDVVKQLIPPLSEKLHKGQAGRVGVVGGSEDYTGAPFFSAISAMRLGADLGHIFCDVEAATVIKSYSPDLIVHPYMHKSPKSYQKDQNVPSVSEIVDTISQTFSRLHVLVVGPGLSRDKLMLDTATGIIQKAKEQDMAIVLDADGLFLVQNNPDVVKGYAKAVLTPNVVEFKRLCEAMNLKFNEQNNDNMAEELSKAFGGKRHAYNISSGYNCLLTKSAVFMCDAVGGLKRVGGQGDILSGAIATFLAWGKAYQDKVWEHDSSIAPEDISLYAGWAGCRLVRECAHLAYEKHGRAVLTSDMALEVGEAYRRVFDPGG
ncbi:hypothetical protein BZG36_03760 [Bifiguratus adelaidae]|uniref:ATP-dependent (S)-NAD(P)H-hydrate dehydratase n=1 Tax=Bifiguratus adelaidae TaxID=1938954 RepID=A0A261Y078_9FUNG|nr:hypothetical protein BZG36_03760 [Bifiguratus adelaidae]